MFLGVWKLLSFLRLPSWDGSPSLTLCLSFYVLSFVLPPFEGNGLLFWVPDVLCQRSEVVLWNLLSVQMFSLDEFVWEKVVSPFLHHLRTASPFLHGTDAYLCLPVNWMGICTSAFLTPQMNIVPNNQILTVLLAAHT